MAKGRKPTPKQLANLIPNNKRSPKKLREMCRKGGIASGKARREKRSFRERVKAFAECPVSKEQLEVMQKNFKHLRKLDKDTTMDDATLFSLYYQAINKHDIQAIKYIIDMRLELEPKEDDEKTEMQNSENELISAINSKAKEVWNGTE